MPITVNGEPHPHREGLTVQHLLDELKFTWALKTVFIDDSRVRRDQYEATVIADGAEVKVLHLMAGG